MARLMDLCVCKRCSAMIHLSDAVVCIRKGRKDSPAHTVVYCAECAKKVASVTQVGALMVGSIPEGETQK